MSVKVTDAWRGWYHINGNTYGTWLRGDDRGWRARHHREHVIGDYKNPPPKGLYREQLQISKRLMGSPVRLGPDSRELACNTLVSSLQREAIEVIACCVTSNHFHLLARFTLPDTPGVWSNNRHQPIYGYIRHVVGKAKSASALALSRSSRAEEGGVWAKRFKITPVTDRDHQLAVFRYILRHQHQDGATWRFEQPKE
ncbi:MAG TPA: hypothetical protein VF777_11710 [Phycisphaerales bacterium]